MRLEESTLRALCPKPRSGAARQRAWDGYVAALSSEEAASLFQRYGITTQLRMAHVLANWAHETGGFQIIWESGAYSATRIMQIFGVGRHSARVTASEARRLAYNGPALFDRVYGIGNPRKANELGNDRPGDGWKYRGCGIVQITGKRDHFRYAAMVGCRVEDLQKPLNSVHAALCEWERKNCSNWADKDDYIKVRKLINGGRNGLADVRQYLARAKVLLADMEEITLAPDDAPLPVRKPQPDDPIAIGSEGPMVEWLQQRLMLHGYYPGQVDGVFSVETEKQLVAWQLQHGFNPNGVFDPKDAEQRDALNISKVLADDAPPKRDIEAADLKERGSETVESTSWWKGALKWLFGLNAAAAADQASGLGAMNTIVSQGENVKNLVDRTGSLAAWMPSTKALIIVGIGVFIFILYKAFDKIEIRRVTDARTGANTGR